MLAVRYPGSPPHRRGRSRQISQAALARQASEERRSRAQRATFPTRTSSNEKSVATIVSPAPIKPFARPAFIPQPSAPPPIDYYDSPPSPPRSLVDQVHVAYANDDIQLAKMLLLRLKGIHVTSVDDPRVAAVKDEDFDFCFFPHGRLMDEESERAIQERQRIELEELEERKREERLRDCERIWESEKKRLRDAKTLALQQRELEEKRKAQEEQRRIALLQESPLVERRAPSKRHSRPVSRNIVSYKLIPSSLPHNEEPFVYDSMPLFIPRPIPKPAVQLEPRKSMSPFSRPLFDDTRTVPFSDVLVSMQGPLFPPERRQASPLSSSVSQDRKRRREIELLDSLLKVVEWERDERRKRKGKAPEKPVVRRRNSDKSSSITQCAACSSSSTSSSSSSSTASSSSRRSWLSFSGVSSSSLSTAATTPSSSPPKYFHHTASSSSKVQPKSWFLTPSSSLHLSTPPVVSPVAHSCKAYAHLTPVSPADSPLPLSPSEFTAFTPPHRLVNRSTSLDSVTIGLDDAATSGGTLLRRVSQLLDIAKGFQSAYINATMFAMSASHSPLGSYRVGSAYVVSIASTPRSITQKQLRKHVPEGARARPTDVQAFLGSKRTRNSNDGRRNSSGGGPGYLIPLRPYTPVCGDDEEEIDDDSAVDRLLPRTPLPHPLPYTLHFKPHYVPPRSPWQIRARMNAEGIMLMTGRHPPVVSRIRPVENAAHLRIRAVENSVGCQWSPLDIGMGFGFSSVRGDGFGRTGMRSERIREEWWMGSGREKILGRAYEEIGRSRLGIEAHQEDERWREIRW